MILIFSEEHFSNLYIARCNAFLAPLGDFQYLALQAFGLAFRFWAVFHFENRERPGCLLGKRTEPNVAKAHRTSMTAQAKRASA